jgi:hypothetical protein
MSASIDVPAAKTGKAVLAIRINAAHKQAIDHADKAIHFAKQAGDLLLLVKADLPHGDFLPWVEANCTVSLRQAQRYVAAAQGKRLPISAIKYDTVSHLPEAQPKSVNQPIFDLQGIPPELFKKATQVGGALGRLAECCKSINPIRAAGGFQPHEISEIKAQVQVIRTWMGKFVGSRHEHRT